MRLLQLPLAAILLATGCFRARTVPPIELYRLIPPSLAAISLPALSTDELVDGSVAVSRFVTPGLYGQRGIVYRVGESGYGTYPSREWAIPLGEMLGRRTSDLLLERPLTRENAMFDPPARRAFTYSWRGTVREFEEINRGNEVFVAVNLEATLVRIEDDSILWSGGGRAERPVPEGTIEGIVNALSGASDEVIVRLIEDARVSMRQKSANGAGAQR